MPRDLSPGKRRLPDDALTHELGSECPDGPKVALYGVLRKAAILRSGERMAAETLLLLKVQDKDPDLTWADLANMGGMALRVEEAFEVGYASGHGLYGLLTLALSLSAEAVACNEGR